MRAAMQWCRPGATLLAAIAIVGLGMAASLPSQAATGYWRFSSYATKPPQSDLDAVAAATAAQQPGRVYEARATGAFQPARSGAGTVELYFKTDNVDRQVYLTTLNFSFTTGVDMLALTPGDKLRFRGVLTMGGNGLAKAFPASGSGKMAAGNGDYFLTTEGAIDQPANGEGELQVPNGGPGSTLIIYAAAIEKAYGALGGTLEIYYEWVEGTPPSPGVQPPPGPAADALGSRLDVNELDGLWIGVWIRRPGTDVFDAVWRSAQYPEVRDVIRIETISGNEVVLTRDGNGGRYYGTISPDGSMIAGTASWYTSGMSWSAQIGGR